MCMQSPLPLISLWPTSRILRASGSSDALSAAPPVLVWVIAFLPLKLVPWRRLSSPQLQLESIPGANGIERLGNALRAWNELDIERLDHLGHHESHLHQGERPADTNAGTVAEGEVGAARQAAFEAVSPTLGFERLRLGE